MRRTVAIAAILAVAAPGVASAQELETETARLLRAGAFKAGAGLEYQISSEGTELAVPLFGEVGLLDRLELTVEPVAFVAILPKEGRRAEGLGDVEVTLAGLALEERDWLPAIALAAEVKIPTARNELIGTREVDYAGTLILSKRFGDLDVHLNAGYAILGEPPGTHVNDIFVFAAAAKYFVDDRLDLFAEILGNTSSSSDAEGGGSTGTGTGTGTSPELAGNELIGTIGAGYRVAPSVLLSLSMSYDNNDAITIHPGITISF